MKAQNVMNYLSTYCKTKFRLPILFILLTASHIPFALGGPPPINPPGLSLPLEDGNGNNPHKSRQQFEQYVKDKYKQIKHAESDVKQTQHGPSGDVWLNGKIVAQRKAEMNLSALPDRHARSRAIAKAFMDDEPILLGINNPDEFREEKIYTSKGGDGDYTNIVYKKYINNIQYQGGVHITVGPDYVISSVNATLTPASPEVYEATKKKTLTEEEIKAIVDKNLTENEMRDFERKKGVMTFRKYAIATPPYVIWETSKIYTYTIDAFTGNILTKYSNIIPFCPDFKQQKGK